jgi:hypothetical protein
VKAAAQQVDLDVPGSTKPCPPHRVAAAKLAERSVLPGSSVAPAAYRRATNNTAGRRRWQRQTMVIRTATHSSHECSFLPVGSTRASAITRT